MNEGLGSTEPALSDSFSCIFSSRLFLPMKVVGIPKAFGRLSRHIGPRIRTQKIYNPKESSRCIGRNGTTPRRACRSAHHEGKFKIPFPLSDSSIGISSSRLLLLMKVVGIPKAFGRLSRHIVPIHREERCESSESLSKGNLPKTGTLSAKFSRALIDRA